MEKKRLYVATKRISGCRRVNSNEMIYDKHYGYFQVQWQLWFNYDSVTWLLGYTTVKYVPRLYGYNGSRFTFYSYTLYSFYLLQLCIWRILRGSYIVSTFVYSWWWDNSTWCLHGYVGCTLYTSVNTWCSILRAIVQRNLLQCVRHAIVQLLVRCVHAIVVFYSTWFWVFFSNVYSRHRRGSASFLEEVCVRVS